MSAVFVIDIVVLALCGLAICFLSIGRVANWVTSRMLKRVDAKLALVDYASLPSEEQAEIDEIRLARSELIRANDDLQDLLEGDDED